MYDRGVWNPQREAVDSDSEKQRGYRPAGAWSELFLGGNPTAGVVVHCPPLDHADNSATSDATFIELVVDGDVVDLNRLPLPADTPIMDERFKDGKNK